MRSRKKIDVSRKKILQHAARLSRRTEAPALLHAPPFPDRQFEIVYADPPWSYYGSAVKDAAAAKHYPLMSQDELASLPLRNIMEKRSALFMWATGPRLHFAMELLRRWNLHFRGVLYVWVKTSKRGTIISGQGVPPTFTKPTTEFLLAATTVRTGRPFPILDLAQAQVVLRPRAEHSKKPADFRTMIEQLCGERSRIELFAREPAPGWDSWGSEMREPESLGVLEPGTPKTFTSKNFLTL